MALASSEACYTLLAAEDAVVEGGAQVAELKSQLEKGDDETRIAAMKRILNLMTNGDPLPQLLMFVIRFVLPSKNKTLKKLLLLYYEIAQKKNPDGKLKQEFILICNAIRNDLQHPNEFVRGSTLRTLCKVREPEILEPLVPSIRSNLEHRHPYVRKNALLAILTVYKYNENLMPDAPEFIQNYMNSEQDMSCRRNAFIMLYNCDQQRAVDYLSGVIDQVGAFPESLQLVIIELIRKVCRTTPAERPKYVKCVYDLMNSSSHAVKYESAAALMALSVAPTAVKAAASCYVNLILKESDNNVKLIVLDRVNELRQKHGRVLDELIMDILRVLASPDIEVRRKCIRIALEMVSSRNVNDVIAFLKKELAKAGDDDFEKSVEYRRLLVQAVHQCAIRFQEVAASVVHTLMDFLGDSHYESAVDVITFVREVVEKFPHLRNEILAKLLASFTELKLAKIMRGALWVLGEYSHDQHDIEASMAAIRAVLGEVPILAAELREAERFAEESNREAQAGSSTASLSVPVTRVTVLPDGTYSTQTTYTSDTTALAKANASKAPRPPLRALLLEGDFFVGTALAVALVKLALRYSSLDVDKSLKNRLHGEALLIMSSILRLGKSDLPTTAIDADSFERIASCLRVLLDPTPVTQSVFLEQCHVTYATLLASQTAEPAEAKDELQKKARNPDALIQFRQLKTKRSALDDLDDQYEQDLTRATGADETQADTTSKLSRIVQLTGNSDTVYAEAYVNVHQYDILLDVLIVNQTNDTLQNLALELATLGDLKLVERPSSHTLGPRDFLNIKANLKVSSTDTGVIFGNIVYDTTAHAETNVVVLNDIHIDIMDYIQSATCTETEFRQMWAEFEWENKVIVNTNITDLAAYLSHLMSRTNMNCLTPRSALEGDCGFLAANLYARSIFGEDALANVCLEKMPNRKVTGHIRIRSKTQGIALSLGDKITVSQKNDAQPPPAA